MNVLPIVLLLLPNIGKMICDMFDQKMIKYVCVDNRPKRGARNQGIPVYFGDATRMEVLRHFDLSHAKACVVCISDPSTTNKVVEAIRKISDNVPIIVRTKDEQQKAKLEDMFNEVYAMSPILPDDSGG